MFSTALTLEYDLLPLATAISIYLFKYLKFSVPVSFFCSFGPSLQEGITHMTYKLWLHSHTKNISIVSTKRLCVEIHNSLDSCRV